MERSRQTRTTKDHRRQEANGRSSEAGAGVRVYLRKPAASEEAEEPENLTGDPYTDLRRQGGTDANHTGGGEER